MGNLYKGCEISVRAAQDQKTGKWRGSYSVHRDGKALVAATATEIVTDRGVDGGWFETEQAACEYAEGFAKIAIDGGLS